MFKAFLIVASGVLAGAPALAGPFVNVENNGGYSGGDYVGSITDLHVGYEGGDSTYGYYAQLGPAIVAPDDGDAEMEVSAKVGGSVNATEKLNFYGEVSFITTDDDPSFGTKIGAKYSF
ncbi:MAG: hypothetical protein Unbinned1819contig1001_26 [Prokaryotic dsDNA virus sp.]|nr:MAG: hypothetical protein Unbinned1819contig1001_26 [Prokaryotic dsDNA virus sp.]|tara:strand:+ start:16653 stop:17009 length:357 start_codon:yes stop_codon:yes gene_type:complete